MKQAIRWTPAVAPSVVLAMIVIAAAATAAAESPNQVFMEQLWTPPATVGEGDDGGALAEGYSSPTVISGSDFRNDGLDMAAHFYLFSGGYVYASASNCMMAPVYVPQGATMTAFWGSYYDDDATYDVSVSLTRVNNYTGAVDVLAVASSSGQSTGIQNPQAPTLTNPVVVYPDYSYYVTTCLYTGNTRILGNRVYWSK